MRTTAVQVTTADICTVQATDEFGTTLWGGAGLGWNWFAIQLEDGRSLMIYQFRRADGSMDPRSSGTLVNANGTTVPITGDSGFRLEPGRSWTSPPVAHDTRWSGGSAFLA